MRFALKIGILPVNNHGCTFVSSGSFFGGVVASNMPKLAFKPNGGTKPFAAFANPFQSSATIGPYKRIPVVLWAITATQIIPAIVSRIAISMVYGPFGKFACHVKPDCSMNKPVFPLCPKSQVAVSRRRAYDSAKSAMIKNPSFRVIVVCLSNVFGIHKFTPVTESSSYHKELQDGT
jgi:hypothetical protein